MARWLGGLAAATILIGFVVVLLGWWPRFDRGATGGPYPAACMKFEFSQTRCRAIVERARQAAAVAPEAVASTTLLPFRPRAEIGGLLIAVVELRLVDGSALRQEVWCMGIGSGSDRACSDDPRIAIGGGVDHDIPCPGTPPAGCATLPPSPRPASIAGSLPLHVATVSIPLDRVGHYEVEVGAASLPDGALSERFASLVDPRPTAYWIDTGIRLEVRPDIAGRPPIGSVYRDPFDGPEPVHAFLVFDVVEREEGAVLVVTDVVVR